MGKRDDEYRLENMVEYDEVYVTKATSSNRRSSKEEEAPSRRLWLRLWPNSTVLRISKMGEIKNL